MQTVREHLMAARARVEAGWCKYVLAEDAEGESLGRFSHEIDWSRAACVCSSGALFSVDAGCGSPAYEALAKAVDSPIVSLWNDQSTKKKSWLDSTKP